MFTGIIEDIGTIKLIEIKDFGKEICIDSNKVIFKEISIGDSLSINGVCLTLVEKYNNLLKFQVVAETLKCTNLGLLKVEDIVNLERAMKASSRFDGHILQGHIETVGFLKYKNNIGKALIISIEIEKKFIKYCIVKGSIAINGISLTIAKIEGNVLSIAIIPITNEITSIGYLEIGDKVNIETDIVAKYVENLVKFNEDDSYLKQFQMKDN